MRARALVLGFVIVLSGLNAEAGQFRVGLSKVDLTPLPPGVSAVLMRTGAPAQPNNFADGLDLGLTVRAAYVANLDGTQPVVLVSADLINLCAADSDYARDPSHYGDPHLTRERILVSITHTHNAPAACDTSMRVQGDSLPRADADINSTWRVHVRNKFREAIQLAYDRSKLPSAAASLKFARSKLHLGFNRRSGQILDLTNSTGTAEAAPNGYDQTADAVNIVGDDGLRKGVLFFYGMHPVGLMHGSFPDPSTASACRPAACGTPQTGHHYFHPDYPGFARSWIENATPENDIAIFFQGAGGNVIPVVGCWIYCTTRTIGEDLGAKVLSMLAPGAQNAITGDITASTNTAYNRIWAAPLQTAAGDHRIGGSAGEMRGNATPAVGTGEATHAWGLWATHYCFGTTGHGGDNPPCVAKPGLILDRSQDMEFQTLTIGNWRVAGLAHEPVTSWGLKLRQNWPGQWVTAVGYTNREHNYLPTSADLDQDDSCFAPDPPSCGGYEGFVAQLLNGNPAPWATRLTTATTTTGATYDLDAELAHVLKLQTPARVNYALRWHGSTATASSEMDSGRLAYAAINGDRIGLHWGSDPATGSGWHDDTFGTYPDWIEVDFGTPRTIDEIDVFTPQNGVDIVPPVEPTLTMTCDDYGLLDYEVQYWESSRWPARWITVKNGAVTNNDKVWRKFTFPALTTMKIRVLVTASRGGYSRVVELEAWGNATSRPNVALTSSGATATASSWLDNNRLPIAAINGDRAGIHWGSDPTTGSGWHDATMNDFTDDWLEVQFAGPRRINEINVFNVQNNWNAPATPTETMEAQVVHLIDFQVQYWNGAQWAVIPGGTVTGNNLVWRKFTFLPITTSKIRVVVTNGAASYSRIVELEALMPYDFLSSIPP